VAGVGFRTNFSNLKIYKMIQQFKTEQIKGIFLKVEEGCFYNMGISEENVFCSDTNDSANWKQFTFQLPNNYRIVGFIDNLTDDDKKSICDLTTDLGFEQLYESYDQASNQVSLNASFDGLCNSYDIYSADFYTEPDHLKYKNRNQFNELVWTSRTKEIEYHDDYDYWLTIKDRTGHWLVLVEC
jgi:hypothetical protein